MEVVFVDPEPPDPSGGGKAGNGGIRTYLTLMLAALRRAGVAATIYTHNPRGYPGEMAMAIGRRPWLPFPLRSLAYHACYHENVLWEHARWLAEELVRTDAPGRVYEFCDFMGYATFAFADPRLRHKTILRIHTPRYLAAAPRPRPLPAFSWWLGRSRERRCLLGAPRITAPSAEFVAEALPWLTNWTHLPNPLPDERQAASRPGPSTGTHILYLGRVEERKGVLVLVRAFLGLAQEHPGATLTLVGGASPGAYGERVADLLAAQPPGIRQRLRWEPACAPEERSRLFSRFTVLAVPSLWENSPYVYFEGMAAGLLCVGSATGEMKAAARVTGGILARPGDAEDWLAALRKACGDADANRARLAAQLDYLRDRREAIPARALDYYSKVAEGR